MIIEANFQDVPDFIPPVATGIYRLQIETVETKPPEPKPNKPLAKGTNIILSMTIQSDGPFKGRKMRDYIYISSDPEMTAEDRKKNLVQIKRVALSAGADLSHGLNVMGLAGKIVLARIAQGFYTDKSGQQRESSNIDRYFIPGDAEFSQNTGAAGVSL